VTPSTTTLHIAHWIEQRLDVSLGFRLPASRLYGIVVNDPLALCEEHGQAGRYSFLEEGPDVYAMLAGPSGQLARSFDAAALVSTGWAAPMLDDGTMTHRASRHPLRRRVRAVAVIDNDGIASVLRFEDDPTVAIGEARRGIGNIVDAMEAMWYSEHAEIVNLRTTRGGCSRRP